MLESFNTNSPMEYTKLSQEECEARGILGRLVGKIADWKRPTRNGRSYSKELWENVFNSDLMKERIDNRLCFGEIQHPSDGRQEIDPEKIAICLAEEPKFGNDGFVYGVFDILSTPCGKILKTLLDYGSKIAVSSRGEGDIETDFEGNEAVNPDTYECVGWDVVFLPGVREARPAYVTESLNNKKSLKESLNDLVESANGEDKRIMEETIKNLELQEKCCINNSEVEEDLADKVIDAHDQDEYLWNLHDCDYTDFYDELDSYLRPGESTNARDAEGWPLESNITLKDLFNRMPADKQKDFAKRFFKPYIDRGDEIDLDESQQQEEADDIDGMNEAKEVANSESDVYDEFQEALNRNVELEGQITELQEKLSVCYAKEAKQEGVIQKLNKAIGNASVSATKTKGLESRVSELTEELAVTKKNLNDLTEKYNDLSSINHTNLSDKRNLNESLIKQSNEIDSLNDLINSLASEKDKLRESLVVTKKNYSDKLAQQAKLIEKYKGIAGKAVDKYIESQALKVGCNVNEIKNRLPENYSFNDIDLACEDVRSYKIGISKLPFRSMAMNENIQVKVKPSKDSGLVPHNDCDDIDSDLLALANLK